MKIAHFSDLHYAPGNIEESDRCFGFGIDHAVLAHADVAVISGDATDHRLDAHAPSLNRLARRINGLSGSMPVLMLQGTFSHEPPGTLRNFELMATTHQIYVAERVQQVSLHEGRFYPSSGPVYSEEELREVLAIGADVVFTCLPTVNKGQLAAAVGAKEAGTGLEAVLGDYLAAAGRVNQQLRGAGIRTVGVSHGTVNGCTTEHGVTMVAIDFFLSMHHYAPHAFPALAVWHDVNVLGRRYPIPKLEPLPKPEIVMHGWYPVGEYDREAPSVGLRSFDAEQWNPYRHPDRPGRYARTTGGEQTVYFEEASQFEVGAEAACLFVTCEYGTAFMLQTQHRDAIESARFWLNEGIVKLPTGMAQRYHDMAKRGQYFARLAQRLNLTPAELDVHLVSNAISDTEHDALLGHDKVQLSLFEEAA